MTRRELSQTDFLVILKGLELAAAHFRASAQTIAAYRVETLRESFEAAHQAWLWFDEDKAKPHGADDKPLQTGKFFTPRDTK